MFDWLKRKPKTVDIGITPKDVALTILPPSTFTPDTAKLEKYALQLLFVCDEWMSDRRQHFVLEDVGAERHRQKMVLTRHGYNFRIHTGTDYRPDNSAIPLLEPRGGRKIKGELYSVHGLAFEKSLDKLKQNGVQFIRRRIEVLVVFNDKIVFENTTEDRRPLSHYNHGVMWNGKFPKNHPLGGKKEWVGPERVCIVDAWMYEANPHYWARFKNPAEFEMVDTFKPGKERKWLSDYYRYQNPPRRE